MKIKELATSYLELNESPQIVPDEDFELGDEKNNKLQAQKLLKQPKEMIKETEDYWLFRVGDEARGHITMIDKDVFKIRYLVEYEVHDVYELRRMVTQISLWRDLDYPHAIGISKNMFHGYIMNKWDAIMSDSMQTKDGMKFWRQRLTQAASLGLIVGLYNPMGDPPVNQFDPKKEKYETWISNASKAWSPDPESALDRFYILKV